METLNPAQSNPPLGKILFGLSRVRWAIFPVNADVAPWRPLVNVCRHLAERTGRRWYICCLSGCRVDGRGQLVSLDMDVFRIALSCLTTHLLADKTVPAPAGWPPTLGLTLGTSCRPSVCLSVCLSVRPIAGIRSCSLLYCLPIDAVGILFDL